MPAEPFISVVVPAYNAEATLSGLINAVLGQKYHGGVELVIVDDGSTDSTGEIVKQYREVRYVRQENAGPASARNRGAREAKGDFIFFTDSDCCPREGWIADMMAGFRQEDVAVVAGSYGIANPSSALARVIHADIMFRHHKLMPLYPKAFGSYNFAVRRGVFEAVGGFNDSYRRASGEDNDLSYKILAAGGRILFLKDACVDHYHPVSLPRYMKEQFRHGFWRVRMYLDHPRMMGGDGYTFWKDMIEIPLAVAQFAFFFWPIPGFVVVTGSLVFQFVFGRLMMCSWAGSLWAGVVLWLRAFARTAGFVSGGVVFLGMPMFKALKNLKRTCGALPLC